MVIFHGFESLVRMGGYGSAVWPAFTIGFVLLFANYMFVRSQFRRAKKVLKKRTEGRVAHESGA